MPGPILRRRRLIFPERASLLKRRTGWVFQPSGV